MNDYFVTGTVGTKPVYGNPVRAQKKIIGRVVMNDIKKKFEKEWRYHDGDNYPFGTKRLCLLVYESMQPEIEDLKGCNAVLGDYINNHLWNDQELLTDINELREKVKKALDLITKCDSEKTVEKRCKSWNDGFAILREIAKENN